MYWLGVSFFLCSLLLTVFFVNKRFDKNILIWVYCIFGFCLSSYVSFNISTLSRDYLNYSLWFKDIFYNTSLNNIFFGKDPIFQFIVSIIQNVFFSQEFAVYFVISYVIFFIKIKFSSLFFNSLGATLLMWLLFSQTFILFEVTQIRAGLAISLASFAILRGVSVQKNDWITSIMLFFSVFIHFSTILLVIIYFIIFFKEIIVNRITIFSVLLFGIVLGLFFDKFFQDFFISKFSENIRFVDYLNDKNVENLSLFSIFFILKFLMVLLLLFFWDQLRYCHKVAVFLSAIGCSLQIILSFNIVFGLRFSELFILFSLSTFVIPVFINKIDVNIRYIYILFLLGLGFIFYISSTNILLG